MNKKDDEKLQALSDQMHAAQESLQQVTEMLKQMGLNAKDLPEPRDDATPSVGVSVPRAADTADTVAGKVIEGHFDGQNMIGPDGKTYPVPANYASKSKLVEGDLLKLTIAADGSFIYKQIGPVERKKLISKIGLDNGQFVAIVGDHHYRVLYASVTYFKAQVGDEVTIVVPATGGDEANWAAIEAVIGS
ncbi:MAG: hypothetical protein U0516_02350 [Candidatus Saccharibacteria bacterium]